MTIHEQRHIGQIVCPWCNAETGETAPDPDSSMSDLDGHSDSMNCVECKKPFTVSLSVEYTCTTEEDMKGTSDDEG